MSQNRRPKQADDPFKLVLDALFRGTWFLLSLPFRSNKVSGEKAKQKADIQAHWQRIEELVQAGQWREAVMKADILLGQALEWAGVTGEGVGEKLKNGQSRFDRAFLDMAWAAHKVRNRIAHEIESKLESDEGRRTINQFKQVLKELGLL